MLMTHGWSKVRKIVAGDFDFSDPIGLGEAPSLVLAAGAEFVFALLVVLGVRVRWTAIPPAIIGDRPAIADARPRNRESVPILVGGLLVTILLVVFGAVASVMQLGR